MSHPTLGKFVKVLKSPREGVWEARVEFRDDRAGPESA